MTKRLTSAALALLFLVASPSPLPAQRADDAWKDLFVQAQHAAGEKDIFKAEQLFQKALHEAERFGSQDPRVASTWAGLGFAYQAVSKFPEAESALRRALGIADWGDKADTVDVADLNFSLGSVLSAQAKYNDALPVFGRSLAIYSRLEGGESLRAAAVHCAVGDTYRGMKSWSLAEAPLKRCADIREADGGILSEPLADALFSLALVYQQEGKLNLADPRFKLAARIREKTQGIMSPGFAEVLEAHAVLLRALHRDKDADQNAALAATIRRHQRAAK